MKQAGNIEQLSQQIADWINENTTNVSEQAKQARSLFDAVTDKLAKQNNWQNPAYLQAPNAVIEVIANQQVLVRRYLEVAFEENQNGLRLLGEDLKGNPAQIVFLSQSAIEKMHQLGGEGANEPQCDTHK